MPGEFDLEDLIAETLAAAPPKVTKPRRDPYSVIALVPIAETHNPFNRRSENATEAQ